MELVSSPFPHLIGSLSEELYQRCIDTWPAYKEVNEEGRYNVNITNKEIVTELTNVTKKCMVKLLPFLLKEYPKWKPSNLDIRFQYAGNIVSNTSYKMRDWHIDNGNKIIVGLWYFKHPDDTNDAGLHITDGTTEIYYPYESNRFVFIPNLPNAWHKVGDRSTWTHERRFVNIVIESNTFLHDYLRDPVLGDSVRPVKNLMI